MSENRIEQILIDLIGDYIEKDELKEVCISLYESGELRVGGRKMLISEISDEQPFEETVGCIQIVFASSSDIYFGEDARDNVGLAVEFRDLLIDRGSAENAREFLKNFPVSRLKAVAPRLELISFENKWKNT